MATPEPLLAWAEAARAGLALGPTALVTVLGTRGSAPRGAGTRMVVTAGGLTGTIGGGRLEHVAIDQARRALALPPGAWRVQDYPLGPLLGQCCGGQVRLLVERLDPARADWLAQARPEGALLHSFGEGCVERRLAGTASIELRPAPGHGGMDDEVRPGIILTERLPAAGRPLLMFGAGHVGRAIAARVGGLPLRLTWYDNRPEAAPDSAVVGDEATLLAAAAAARHDAAILILTHDHGLDYRLAAAALRSPAAFVGLIGSATKRARFLSRLARDGFDAPARARLTCPIGLAGIAGRAPDVIAVAVLAQLLLLDRGDA